MGLKKPAEKQVVAQPKGVPVAGVKPSVPPAEKAQAAPAPATESTQTAALQEEVNELKEQVGQVAEAGSAEQKAETGRLLTELRRQVYLLLAEAPEEA